MRRRRTRRWGIGAVVLAAGLMAAGCSSTTDAGTVTVTSMVTVPPTGPNTTSAATESTSSPAASRTTAATDSAGTTATASGTTTGPTSTAGSATASTPGPGYTEPDGFKITKLAPGEQAPQFVVVSFDGAGWHEKWQYWQGIADKVPFHFTGFLTGLYLLTEQTKDNYQGPGHGPGKTSLGSWNSAADTRQEIVDLNDAYQRGDEIGTHFNGHFCDDNPPGAFEWNHTDWDNELDQFFHFLTDYQALNPGDDLAKLDFGPSEVRGERTPCLEGNAEDLFPALIDHHMIYDSSFTRRGISWPKKSPQYKIWQMGMAEFPIHGTTPPHFQITMDYNFWFTQENASSTVDPAKSAQDATQVQATYQDMFDATYNGNRAPLILGNHFEEWNNNAYTTALGNFVLANCGKPDTYCVPFRDVVDWMQAQDPQVLAALQNQGPELGGGSAG